MSIFWFENVFAKFSSEVARRIIIGNNYNLSVVTGHSNSQPGAGCPHYLSEVPSSSVPIKHSLEKVSSLQVQICLPRLSLVVVFLHFLVPAVHRVAGLHLDLSRGGPAGVDVLTEVAVRAVVELVVGEELLRPGLGQLTQLPVQDQGGGPVLGPVLVVALQTLPLVLGELSKYRNIISPSPSNQQTQTSPTPSELQSDASEVSDLTSPSLTASFLSLSRS